MYEHNRRLRPSHSRASHRLLLVVVLAAAGLVAAACGSDDQDAAAGGDGGSGSGDPTVTITTPGNGAVVGTSFEVQLDLGFEIGEPDTGRRHIHLHHDDSSEYDIVYSETHTAELEPGEHTIVAVVANADHSETDVRSAPVTVTVTDDPDAVQGMLPPADGSDTGTTPTTTGGAGFGY